jgi:non-ribosomal peptide synthetase component F/thioesterase domain-containing protein/acyl carrier protein
MSRAELLTLPDEGHGWLADDPRPVDWNGPTDRPFTPFSANALDQPIIDHFERVVRQHRERIAIRDGVTTLTFGELWHGVSGLAEALAARTKPGDLIGILLPAGPMFPLAMLACLASGRPFVALDTHYPRAWLEQVLKNAGPTLVIAQQEGVVELEACAPTTHITYLTSLPTPAQEGWRPARADVDEPACVLLTSGSTGRPRGIVNSQRNLLQRVSQSINAAHIDAEDRLLTLAPPGTIVAVRDVMTALLAGASVRILDPHEFGVREILNAIRADGITILFAFPALLRSVVAASTAGAGAALRLVRVGGDTTFWSDIDLLRAWLGPNAAIQSIYAATEAPMLQWFVNDAHRGEDSRVPIGYPLPGNHLAIVDPDGAATPRGEVGELLVASPYVSLGQWVAGRCVPEGVAIRDGHATRVFRTGDLVRQRPDGLLERLGRNDRQVKIRGVRVDLDGVEAALREHPLVQDVGVVARTSSVDGAKSLSAYVSTRAQAPAGLIDDLRDLMRSAPSPMRPQRFYLLREIPRLPSSKLDARTLTALDDSNVRSERLSLREEAEIAQVGGDGIAQTIAGVWQAVLHVPVATPEDDFFDAGGDSLQAISFIFELERALGLELSPTLLNEAPRFDQLCKILKQRRAPGYAQFVSLKPGEGAPPVFFIHGVGGNVVEILPTARRMSYPGPVIGVQARGLTSGGIPHTSVQAMADEYLREIKARQPRGPYYLCGYSLGGLVAFEMARRLSGSGDEVAFVGLLDTLRSPVSWPLQSWVSIIGGGIRQFASGLRRTPLRAWPAELRRLRPNPIMLSGRALRVAASALLASARYRPGFYRGHLTLFMPAERAPGLPHLDAIWRKHALSVSVEETAGSHATMLSAPNAESTAASLTRCLLMKRRHQP